LGNGFFAMPAGHALDSEEMVHGEVLLKKPEHILFEKTA